MLCLCVCVCFSSPHPPCIALCAQQAGIQLKRNVTRYFDKLDRAAVDHVFVTLVNHVGDPDPAVRRTIANVLSSLIRKGVGHLLRFFFLCC